MAIGADSLVGPAVEDAMAYERKRCLWFLGALEVEEAIVEIEKGTPMPSEGGETEE